MNERIQKLIEHATETFTTYFDGRGNVTETYFDKEKFAELIVKEVFAKIEDERFEVYEPVKEAVMKHFGIE